MGNIIIGIDPDCERSGVAIKDLSNGNVKLMDLSFLGLYEELSFAPQTIKKVYIECGFLNKGNFHLSAIKSVRAAAEIGNRTGRNQETARKICELMEWRGIPYEMVKPTQAKITTQKAFKALTGIDSPKGKYAQDMRDAYMLIHGR